MCHPLLGALLPTRQTHGAACGDGAQACFGALWPPAPFLPSAPRLRSTRVGQRGAGTAPQITEGQQGAGERGLAPSGQDGR